MGSLVDQTEIVVVDDDNDDDMCRLQKTKTVGIRPRVATNQNTCVGGFKILHVQSSGLIQQV